MDGGKPAAVGDRVVPVRADDGLTGMVEREVFPEAWPFMAGRFEEGGVVFVGDGEDGDAEGGKGDAMRRTFVGATFVVANR